MFELPPLAFTLPRPSLRPPPSLCSPTPASLPPPPLPPPSSSASATLGSLSVELLAQTTAVIAAAGPCGG